MFRLKQTLLRTTPSTLKIGVYTIVYSRLAVFSLKSAHSLRSFALTARFARSTGLSALRAIEHYRGRVLNHGRACQRCDGNGNVILAKMGGLENVLPYIRLI